MSTETFYSAVVLCQMCEICATSSALKLFLNALATATIHVISYPASHPRVGFSSPAAYSAEELSKIICFRIWCKSYISLMVRWWEAKSHYGIALHSTEASFMDLTPLSKTEENHFESHVDNVFFVQQYQCNYTAVDVATLDGNIILISYTFLLVGRGTCIPPRLLSAVL